MDECRIGTIRLSGEESISFANSLFRPTHEEVASHNRCLNRINDIVITNNEYGFEADIPDFDLSFLDNEVNSEKIEINVKMTVRVTNKIFSTSANYLTQTTVCLSTNNDYNIIVPNREEARAA